MRLTILQVITDTDRRGAQVFALDLERGLRRRGHEVTTVALAPGSDAANPLEVLSLGKSRRGFRTLAVLRRRIERADVVVAHGSTTLYACALTSLGSGTPFVYRQISDSLYWAPTRWRRARVRTFLSRPHTVVALWDGAAQVLRESFGVSPSRLVVIPNAVDPDRVQAPDQPAPRPLRSRLSLLAVSALVPEKGIDDLLGAIDGLAVDLVVVGDGPDRRRLEEQGSQLQTATVSFAGWQSTIAHYYSDADLLVFPSRGGDSMPAVLIEAGLHGMPAITTETGACSQIVVDGVTGFVVPVQDLLALRSAVETLLTDHQCLRRLGEKAAAHCRTHFSIDVVARKWEQVLLAAAGIT